ncbi:hypothetical protein ACTXT7_014438 [Hymenolepis weldensis]
MIFEYTDGILRNLSKYDVLMDDNALLLPMLRRFLDGNPVICEMFCQFGGLEISGRIPYKQEISCREMKAGEDYEEKFTMTDSQRTCADFMQHHFEEEDMLKCSTPQNFYLSSVFLIHVFKHSQ